MLRGDRMKAVRNAAPEMLRRAAKCLDAEVETEVRAFEAEVAFGRPRSVDTVSVLRVYDRPCGGSKWC